MIALRPYQQALVADVRNAYRGGARSVLMQLGTGGGKTATASAILEYAIAKQQRCVFFAHLDALIGDTHERLTRSGVRAGFVQADRPTDPDALVQVASLQTLHARGERPPADFVILDEAHRAMGPTVRGILAAYPSAKLLGLTATPQRGDGKPLGDVFDTMVCGPSNRELTKQGFLVPCDVLAPSSFMEKALSGDPVRAYEKHTPGRRGLCFCASVPHARDVANAFNAGGIAAAVVVGETPREERARLRDELASGRLRMLVGVGVFVEGWDSPAIEVVILARAFSVTCAFLQSIGRGLRPCPSTGKTKCTVIDLRGSVHLHGLPDENRRWSLEGTACSRTELVTALRRCKDCLAIFRPQQKCPRCGAEHETVERIPRVLHRAEKLERYNDVPQDERDRRYVQRLATIAESRMRMPSHRARAWAVTKFEKTFKRKPVAA